MNFNLDFMKTDIKTEREILRNKAEESLKSKPSKKGYNLSENNTLKLVHELEVQQEEIELQNEEFLNSSAELKFSVDKYFEMFSNAPLGYYILSNDGDILELNECAANLLGGNTPRLKGAKFAFFISEGSRPVFNNFFRKVFKSKTKESCEVILSGNDNKPVYGLLTAIVSEKKKICLLTFIDITERRLTEETLKKKNDKLEWINRIMIAREIRMIELKKEINGLLNKMGEKDKYLIH